MAPAKKVTTPMPGTQNVDSKSVKKFPKNPPKGDNSTVTEPTSGQYTWRVRRKLDGADTPWKSGGPAEIMEVVLRRLEVLESFEKSTKDIERRINNLDKNVLAVAKEIELPLGEEQLIPRPPKEKTPPPPETIMPRPKDAPKPIVPKEEPKKPEEPKKAAVAAAAAPATAAGAAGAKPAPLKKFSRLK